MTFGQNIINGTGARAQRQNDMTLVCESIINVLQQFGDVYYPCLISWWRHQMETFSALLAICAGNSPVTGEFPSQRPVTRSFDVCFAPE